MIIALTANEVPAVAIAAADQKRSADDDDISQTMGVSMPLLHTGLSRLPKPWPTRETGAGVGLSFAARLVEKGGGEIEFQTLSGHGTTFGVVLPRVTPAQDNPPPTAFA